MSQFLKHIACEKCGSSDANALFDDGHTYCYACLTYVAGDGEKQASSSPKKELNLRGDVKSIPDRGITASTCQYYGVTSDETTQSYPYANSEGAIIASKIRSVADKTFNIAGDWKGSTLFGQNLFAKGGKTSLRRSSA